jgi:hypothetical protein
VAQDVVHMLEALNRENPNLSDQIHVRVIEIFIPKKGKFVYFYTND